MRRTLWSIGAARRAPYAAALFEHGHPSPKPNPSHSHSPGRTCQHGPQPAVGSAVGCDRLEQEGCGAVDAVRARVARVPRPELGEGGVVREPDVDEVYLVELAQNLGVTARHAVGSPEAGTRARRQAAL